MNCPPSPTERIERPSVLVTIPAFNEGRRLPPFLDTLLPALGSLEALSITVQVVDDGSRADEKALCRTELQKREKEYPSLSFSFLDLTENQGKGGAILAGWRAFPNSDYYLFVDSDGAVPAAEVKRLIATAVRMEEPMSIFASRIKMLGKTVERSGLRHITGRVFAFMVGVCIDCHVYDSQCGLKILPAAHFHSVDKYLKGHRFAFDVELLAALCVKRMPVKEIPIDWFDVAGSKVSLIRDTVRMLASILAIRKLIKNNYYN